MKKLFLSLVLLASFLPIQAQDKNLAAGGGKTPDDRCGLLYGKNHALTFCAPEGWHLDNGIMNDQGIYAVFYPSESDFVTAKEKGTFMYFNVVERDPASSLESEVEEDAKAVKKNTPKAVISKGEAIQYGTQRAPVLLFAPGGFDRYEAVAYIVEEKVLVMAVISSHSQATFKRDYDAFVKLVQSYKFMGSDVTIKHK